MSKAIRLWSTGDADLDERMDRCVEAFNYRPHLIAIEFKLLRDENKALIQELAQAQSDLVLREVQLMKMANALGKDNPAAQVVTH